jgi:hypothetical protein
VFVNDMEGTGWTGEPVGISGREAVKGSDAVHSAGGAGELPLRASSPRPQPRRRTDAGGTANPLLSACMLNAYSQIGTQIGGLRGYGDLQALSP